MSRRRGERFPQSSFQQQKGNSRPSTSHCYVGSRAPKQRLVWANEGLFPSGTFVFLAGEAVNQRSPKKPMSSSVFTCVTAACCWDCNGIFTVEEGRAPVRHNPPLPSSKTRHLWMISHASNVVCDLRSSNCFTLIFTCECPSVPPVRRGFKDGQTDGYTDRKRDLLVFLFFRHK